MKITKTIKKTVDSLFSEKDHFELKEFFIDELKDIYWAEKHLVKALPKMAKAATSKELKAAFEKHKTVTETHVARLEKVFEALGEKAKAKKCEAMDGLVTEANEIISDTKAGTMVRDTGLIFAAQKVEHYEIATYGSLKAVASILKIKAAAIALLEKTLEEEKTTDQALTKIAESYVNKEALAE